MVAAAGLVGNDVVDLDDPDNGRSFRSARFVARVASAEERARVESARDPYALVASLFAAKEAAFKVVAKRAPDTVFAHRRFRVSAELDAVEYDGMRLALRVERGEGFVHAVVTAGWLGYPGLKPERSSHLAGPFARRPHPPAPSPAQPDAYASRGRGGVIALAHRRLGRFHSLNMPPLPRMAVAIEGAGEGDASAASKDWGVRSARDVDTSSAEDLGAEARALLCEMIAERLACDRRELAVVRAPRPGSWDGFGPPRVEWRGVPVEIDVSLSHDGRFVAAAAVPGS